MDWRERSSRLRAILDEYGVSSFQYIGLQTAIEDLMDEDRADAYEDGAFGERSSGLVGDPQ
jgi:hypothetical protein